MSFVGVRATFGMLDLCLSVWDSKYLKIQQCPSATVAFGGKLTQSMFE